MVVPLTKSLSANILPSSAFKCSTKLFFIVLVIFSTLCGKPGSASDFIGKVLENLVSSGCDLFKIFTGFDESVAFLIFGILKCVKSEISDVLDSILVCCSSSNVSGWPFVSISTMESSKRSSFGELLEN